MSDIHSAKRRTAALKRIATNLHDPGQILSEIAVRATAERVRESRPERQPEDPTRSLTMTERMVAQIWAEVLRLEEVWITDDFFELGGHSLLATQVISRIREMFQVELPIAVMFDGAFTVAELARQIEQLQIRSAQTEDVEELLESVGRLSDEEANSLLIQYSTNSPAVTGPSSHDGPDDQLQGESGSKVAEE